MTCPKCSYVNKPGVHFCGNCGTRLTQPVQIASGYKPSLQKVSLLYFVILGYIAVLYFIEHEPSYTYELTLDAVFGTIVLIFFFFNFKANKKLLFPQKIRPRIVAAVCILAPAFAITVHFLANFINQRVFNTHASAYYDAFSDSPAPMLFSILSIGAVPAVFEEIAFRGVLFSETARITSLKATIIITALLFTLLHFSIISSIWLFPSGLLFGYLRAKYKTLVYGMLGHFLYNSSIVLLQIFLG